jgi:uncharacterized protein YodC (DUF2158 family)
MSNAKTITSAKTITVDDETEGEVEVGDVVRLKSGGPEMTVEGIVTPGDLAALHFRLFGTSLRFTEPTTTVNVVYRRGGKTYHEVFDLRVLVLVRKGKVTSP